MIKKLLIFFTVIFLAEGITKLTSQTVDPQTRTALALKAVNSDNTEIRAYNVGRDLLRPILLVGYAGLALAIFLPKTKQTQTETK